MTLPKKGRRKLTHQGRHYHWIVGKRRLGGLSSEGYYGAPSAHLEISCIIEDVETGALVRALFQGDLALCVPSHGFRDVQEVAITPSVVGKLIEHAIKRLEWRPEAGEPVDIPCAQNICPEAVVLDLAEVDISYDPSKLDDHLQGAVIVWRRSENE